jgi:hypothetical protein
MRVLVLWYDNATLFHNLANPLDPLGRSHAFQFGLAPGSSLAYPIVSNYVWAVHSHRVEVDH